MTGAQRLLGVRTPELAEHVRTLGPLPNVQTAALVAEIERSGLDGRGGAGFPAARKIRAVQVATASSRRRTPIVIANGSEGEPASGKDALLMDRSPHLVLDGLVLAALAVGARDAAIVTTASRLDVLRRAVSARRDPVQVTVQEVQHAFVSGEASAVASTVAGRAGVPTDRAVRLAVSGPDRRPTLVSNVETLASIALIARFGADWFRSVGSASAPGTRLVTVTGPGADRRVLEIEGGRLVGDILLEASVDVTAIRAVFVGGYGGAWAGREVLDAPFDASGLARWGAAPGAGVLVAIDGRTCGLEIAAKISRELASASTGQCGPCVNGLPRLADVMADLAAAGRRGRVDQRTVAEVHRVAALVDGRGACHHPDGAVRSVRSALAVFADDVRAHLVGACTSTMRTRSAA